MLPEVPCVLDCDPGAILTQDNGDNSMTRYIAPFETIEFVVESLKSKAKKCTFGTVLVSVK
jgi:hypothetical protein